MGQITLSIRYAKNTGLAISSTELKDIYFTGIKLEDQFGVPIPETTIDFFLKAAQIEFTNQLSIKITRQAFEETRDYVLDDYVSWGYIPTTYPAVKALSVKGFFNTSLQIDFPQEWLSTKRQSGEDMYWRSINFVPISGPSATYAGNAVYVGITPYINRFTSRSIPNYWTVRYITGFNVIPEDILNVIGRLAATNLLINLGDLVAGAGIASKSIGIDGLSQSISTTSSAMYMAYSARIEAYRKDLERQVPLLKARYCGFTFGTL